MNLIYAIEVRYNTYHTYRVEMTHVIFKGFIQDPIK